MLDFWQYICNVLFMINSCPILFSGQASEELGKRIVTNGTIIKSGEIYHHQFPSEEWYCQFKHNIRGADVFLLQSIKSPANDNLMQLLIMADAARRASAGRITAIIPYLGYGRQDRKDKSRVPISAKLIMDIFAAAGIDRIVTMDLHAPQVAGFTNLPFDHLYFRPALIEHLKDKNIEAVVAPDIGAVKKAEEYAKKLNVELAFISKRRMNDITVEALQFVGNVKEKNILIVDDLTESAGTLINAAEICKEKGATNVYCAVTHNCLSTVGWERLRVAMNNNIINEFIVSNTCCSIDSSNKYKVVDVSGLFASTIEGISNNTSITELLINFLKIY